MRVTITHEARGKLTRIYEYYKDLSKGEYGRKIRASVITRAMRLKDFPFLGQVEESLKGTNFEYRYLVEGNYKIIYRVEHQAVYVTDIFDTRQDPEKIKD